MKRILFTGGAGAGKTSTIEYVKNYYESKGFDVFIINEVPTMLLNNVKKAVKEKNLKKVVLAGGVSANSYIRQEFAKYAEKEKIELFYPEPILCTDNAAMIASAGYYNYIDGKLSDLTLNAVPNLKLGD